MTTAIIRLHICPFSPDLLRAIIPASLAGAAQNISFHQVQSFPEHSYGYVDLPAMEAEKIKKKLNGSILKGKKIKIEDARPQKRRRNEEEPEKTVEQPAATIESTAPKPKKAKKDPRVIAGHELSPERKIKRGWTEAKPEPSKRLGKDKSDRPASKYSEKDELLFRTTVPPNKVRKSAKEDKKNKKKRSDSRIVHEFEKSTSQPSFLRDDGGSGAQAASYVDGKGWVDADGQLIEQEPSRNLRQRRLEQKAAKTALDKKETETANDDDSTSSDSDSSEAKAAETPKPVKHQSAQSQSDDESEETSSSGESDSDSSDVETSSAQANSSPHIIITTTETPPTETGSQPDLHPLEALFKKPNNPASQDIAKPSLEVQTSFSFFEANKDDIEDEPVMPGTPFSSQDLRSRDHRSAAPTPDTAYPSRFNSYGSTMSEKLGVEEEGDKDGDKTPDKRTKRSPKPGDKETSEFEKSFWEKRGENNRGWKQRRRESLKEKRQKENRARKGRGW